VVRNHRRGRATRGPLDASRRLPARPAGDPASTAPPARVPGRLAERSELSSCHLLRGAASAEIAGGSTSPENADGATARSAACGTASEGATRERLVPAANRRRRPARLVGRRALVRKRAPGGGTPAVVRGVLRPRRNGSRAGRGRPAARTRGRPAHRGAPGHRRAAAPGGAEIRIPRGGGGVSAVGPRTTWWPGSSPTSATCPVSTSSSRVDRARAAPCRPPRRRRGAIFAPRRALRAVARGEVPADAGRTKGGGYSAIPSPRPWPGW
jgi:hypothetical protein